MTALKTRPTSLQDLPALRDILNFIIQAGGTTAHMQLMTPEGFERHYFDRPLFVHTVEYEGRPVGFQAVFKDAQGVLGVGSFTDQENPVRGAGAALIESTIAAARAHGGASIDAVIRADNVPGLAYYSKMGFEDVRIARGTVLSDGTTVDKITKRLML
jgi:L-amino acid N-acyltransferase YncA